MDPLGLILVVLFIGGALSVPTINHKLDKRRAQQRRMQAHLRRKGRWI